MVLRTVGYYVDSLLVMVLACLPAAFEARCRASRVYLGRTESKDQETGAYVRAFVLRDLKYFHASRRLVPISIVSGSRCSPELKLKRQHLSFQRDACSKVGIAGAHWRKVVTFSRKAVAMDGYRLETCNFLKFPDDTVLSNARDEIMRHLFLSTFLFFSFSCSTLHS